MEMKWEDGSLAMLTSGKAQPVDAGQKRLAELLGCNLSMVFSPRGRTTGDTQNMSLLNELMSMSSGVQMDMNRLRLLTLGLPDHPVGVGETWTVTDTGKIGEATATSRTDFKLTGIETVDGTRTAVSRAKPAWTSLARCRATPGRHAGEDNGNGPERGHDVRQPFRH